MAQNISNLAVGTEIVDPTGVAPHGNKKFIIVGSDQYGSGTTLCLLNEDYTEIRTQWNATNTTSYLPNVDIRELLENEVLPNLSVNLQLAILNSTNVRYRNSSGAAATITAKIFPLSAREYQDNAFSSPVTNSHLAYFASDTERSFANTYWTRDLLSTSNAYTFTPEGASSSLAVNVATTSARYAFSLPSTAQVADTANPDGSYNLELPAPTTVGDLPIGTVIKDPNGVSPHGDKSWRTVGRSRYNTDNTLCLLNEDYTEIRQQWNATSSSQYFNSFTDAYLSEVVLTSLSINLRKIISSSSIRSRNSGGTAISDNRDIFLLSAREYLDTAFSSPVTNNHISWFNSDTRRSFTSNYFSRDLQSTTNVYGFSASGLVSQFGVTATFSARYAFEIPNTTRISSTPNADGSYNLDLDALQTIADLPIGTEVKDPDGVAPHGNRSWLKIAENHFGLTNSNTFYLNESYDESVSRYNTVSATTYDGSTLDNFLTNTVLTSLSQNMQSAILNTSITIQNTSNVISSLSRKLFAFSQKEVNLTTTNPPEGSIIPYFTVDRTQRLMFATTYWLRTINNGSSGNNPESVTASGVSALTSVTSQIVARYAFNLPSDTRISNTQNSDLSFNLIFNFAPLKPVISQINSVNTSVDSANPQIVSANMQFTTTFQDPDSDTLQAVNLVVNNINDGAEVFNQNITTTNATFTQDLTNIVVSGSQYEIKVRQQDSAGNFSEFSDLVYVQIGQASSAPTPLNPANAVRTSLTRQIVGLIGGGKPTTDQHFRLRLRRFSYSDTGYSTLPDNIGTATTTIDRTTPVEVVAQNYSTEGNGGRKLVRLENGWIVCAVKDNSFGRLYYYVSRDNGESFEQLTLISTLGTNTAHTIVSNGNMVYTIITFTAGATSSRVYTFDATNVNINGITEHTTLDTNQTDHGEVSVVINSAGTELHATWSAKVSTHPNSFNIFYNRGTINAQTGVVTWGNVEQVTTVNTSGFNVVNPTIELSDNNPTISFASNSTSFNHIFNQIRTNGSWDVSDSLGRGRVVFNGGANAQSNPTILTQQFGSNAGRIWVAWHGRDATDSNADNIRYSYSDTNGQTWITAVKLTSGNTLGQDDVVLAERNNGDIHAVWSGNTAQGRIVRTSVWTGSSFGSISQVGTGVNLLNPSALNNYHNFTNPLLIWHSNVNSNVQFYGQWTETTQSLDLIIESRLDQTGWEVSTDGTTYVALPSAGAQSGTYSHVRYTPQTNWVDTKAYIYVWSSWDTEFSFYGSDSSQALFQAGNTLSFNTITASRTNRPEFTLGIYQGTAQTSGTTGSRLIQVTNNGLDATPTLEDATTGFFGNGYTITNMTKVNANWGFQLRVSGTINETVLGSTPVFITGFAYVVREATS